MSVMEKQIENSVKDYTENIFPLLQMVQCSVLHHKATDVSIKSVLTLLCKGFC